ncbi:MAG: hypothetical protein GXO65_07290 [Euryarchaeota archaeon]|nr:hypothetical protein [Euryarchaeota archaeon]
MDYFLSNYEDLKKELKTKYPYTLLGIVMLSCLIDYLGTGFGAGWKIDGLLKREWNMALNQCVTSPSYFSSDFGVLTACIIVGKMKAISENIFVYIIASILLKPPLKRVVVHSIVAFTTILFVQGGLSWYYPKIAAINIVYLNNIYFILLYLAILFAIVEYKRFGGKG